MHHFADHMFGIIVLHKTMVWQSLIDKWNQSVFKNVAIQIGLHYSLENTDFCGATPADASPNMNLKWVFRFWLSFRWFIDLSITRAAKLLKRDGAFVGEDDIIECITRVENTLGELQSLDFVGLSDQLAVSCLLQSPALLFAGSSDG